MTAPTRVIRFHSTNTAAPVARTRPASRSSGWATPTCIDSSIVRCAASARLRPLTAASWRPAGRRGRCAGPAAWTSRWPPGRRPGPRRPGPRTRAATAENSSSERAWVCERLSPAATDKARNSRHRRRWRSHRQRLPQDLPSPCRRASGLLRGVVLSPAPPAGPSWAARRGAPRWPPPAGPPAPSRRRGRRPGPARRHRGTGRRA